MRGYNPVEVDEYISFLIERYTELYRENDELERKLKSTLVRLEELKNDEDSIRSTLIDAKHAANKIKSDAEDRAKSIVRTAKDSCNTILTDFNEKIEQGRAVIAELHHDAFVLKQELFQRYSEHIKYIDSLTEGLDPDAIPNAEFLRREAVGSLKTNIAAMYAPGEDSNAPEEESEEIAEEAYTEEDNVSTTREFSLDDVGEIVSPDATPLTIDREPLISEPAKGSIKDSVLKANRMYKENEISVINTPDSDIDEANYDDFVRSVTGKLDSDSTKDNDFSMLFDDSYNHKKKKK